jgi:hypothetical protein
LRLWKRGQKSLPSKKKLELKDELTKELASKEDIQVLKAEIQAVRAEVQAMEARLEAKIEKEILRLDRKFTILFIILFFTLILVNQNALEFLLKVLGVIK